MGTEKRERQKANRQQRQIEEQRAARASAVKRNILRWVIIFVLALGAVVLIAWIGGAFSSDEPDAPEPDSPGADITLPVDTAPAPTFDTPDKPTVDLPDDVPTELQVTTLIEGDGPEAAAGDTVTVHYVGVLTADGTEFDNSYDRGDPFPVLLGAGRVIQGWDEGLIGARAGERRQLDIPADLAYGDSGSGAVIQPGDALSFVIDVLAVEQGTGS